MWMSSSEPAWNSLPQTGHKKHSFSMFSHFLYLFYNYVYDQQGPYGWAHERLRETNKVIFRCDSNDLVRFLGTIPQEFVIFLTNFIQSQKWSNCHDRTHIENKSYRNGKLGPGRASLLNWAERTHQPTGRHWSQYQYHSLRDLKAPYRVWFRPLCILY